MGGLGSTAARRAQEQPMCVGRFDPPEVRVGGKSMGALGWTGGAGSGSSRWAPARGWMRGARGIRGGARVKKGTLLWYVWWIDLGRFWSFVLWIFLLTSS